MSSKDFDNRGFEAAVTENASKRTLSCERKPGRYQHGTMVWSVAGRAMATSVPCWPPGAMRHVADEGGSLDVHRRAVVACGTAQRQLKGAGRRHSV